MKVKALTSFVGYDGDGKKWRVSEGDEFDLPAGVDWLDKGLVTEAKAEAKAEAKKGKGKKAQENLF